MFKKTLAILALAVALPASAQNKMMQLIVGQYDANKQIDVWSKSDLDRLYSANGFLVLPGAGHIVGYADWRDNCARKCYDDYIDDVVVTLNNIKQSRGVGQADVWISAPPTAIAGSLANPSGATISTFLQHLRTRVKNEVGISFWDQNVKGIYMYDEALNADPGSNIHQYVHLLRSRLDIEYNPTPLPFSDYKGMMIAPYWALEHGINNSHVIRTYLEASNNRAGLYPLFDYIYVQTNYPLMGAPNYQNHEVKPLVLANSLPETKDWAQNQRIDNVYPSNNHIRKTKIGITMELNRGYDLDPIPVNMEQISSTIQYYKEALDVLGPLVANPKVDFLFYADAKDNFNNTPSLYDCINNFYNNAAENSAVASCMYPLQIEF